MTKLALVLISLLALAGLIAGWKTFWFLCDDAYISFRYVHNSVAGHGFVWNPPPFQPVEGYSNFLWVLLLDLFWRFGGVEPPAIANMLSLLASAGILLFAALAAWRLEIGSGRVSHRLACVAFVLTGTLSNRTFLAWTSSGFETALFNLWIMVWLFALILLPVGSRSWGLVISLSAALAALTRPDGLALVACTLLAWIGSLRTTAGSRAARQIWTFSPLLIVLSHLLWRHSFYGAWLPNTYHAKNTGFWPASGLRFLLSFLLEYGLWIFLPLILAAAWLRRDGWVAELRAVSPKAWTLVVALLFLFGHAGYYAVAFGGDHFEYRVLSHLVPLIPLSLLWLLFKLQLRGRWVAVLSLIWLLVSLSLPWTHWQASQSVTNRERATRMRVSVAKRWPATLAWYARPFDSLQFWLIEHFVCVRHQEHKIANLWWQHEMLPSREKGSAIGPEALPVMEASGGIGALGWVLPHVNLIDLYGLNDHVIARLPVPPSDTRFMAHERNAPEAYLAGFRPNVQLTGKGRIVAKPRRRPLTAADVEAHEALWREKVLKAPQP